MERKSRLQSRFARMSKITEHISKCSRRRHSRNPTNQKRRTGARLAQLSAGLSVGVDLFTVLDMVNDPWTVTNVAIGFEEKSNASNRNANVSDRCDSSYLYKIYKI